MKHMRWFVLPVVVAALLALLLSACVAPAPTAAPEAEAPRRGAGGSAG